MAENKKSFILYCDFISTFKELSDAEAGQLIKHIFSYVNDENPVMEDRLLKLVFEPIKQQLKRDLVKYEDIKEFRSEIGKAGGIKSGEVRRAKKEAKQANAVENEANEPNALNTKQNEANEAVTVTVNVNDRGNVQPGEMPLGHEMQQLFVSVNPRYPQKPSKDFPAIIEMACFIHEDLGYSPKQMFEMDVGERKKVLSEWKKWCEWYKINGNNRDLSYLAAFKIQSISMEIKNGRAKPNFASELPAHQQQAQQPLKRL
jgi:hypothetical protein